MKYLYYCNSAYQIINALNINWHRKYANFENIKDYNADLVVLNAFKEASELVEILKNEKVFNKVNLVNRVNNKGMLHTIKSIIGIVNPLFFLKRAGYIDGKYLIERYDYIVAPKFSKATAAIWQLNKKAKLQLFEDGTTSFFSLFLTPGSTTYKLLFKLFNYNRTFFDYESLYLNEPTLFYDKTNNKLLTVPKYDNNYLETVKNMFLSNQISERYNIWWLGQYFNSDFSLKIEKILNKYKEIVIYRPHPRYPEAVKTLNISNDRQIWELKLLNMEDIENKCFIAATSTTVFSPKILYGKEPYVIFLYKMINDDGVNIVNFDKVVEGLKSIYHNKNKIMVPNTIDDFKNCLDLYIKQIN